MPDKYICYKLTIKGRVQGVAFRKYTKRQADKIGLKGFVKNQPDGSVYVEAEGSEEALDQFLLWCYEGSPLARVDHVEVKKGAFNNFADFVITG